MNQETLDKIWLKIIFFIETLFGKFNNYKRFLFLRKLFFVDFVALLNEKKVFLQDSKDIKTKYKENHLTS